MNETFEGLRRKIAAASELGSVVRAMKALAASNIGQYEKAALSLTEYEQSVRLALSLAVPGKNWPIPTATGEAPLVRIVAFGSDQGLIGSFNQTIAEQIVSSFQPSSAIVWAVGERLADSLVEYRFPQVRRMSLPASIQNISHVIGESLKQITDETPDLTRLELTVFHHQPRAGGTSDLIAQRIFPFDQAWRDGIQSIRWPTIQGAEVIGRGTLPFHALLREHLFISLFRACVESLASENACRLAAMQRAGKNIDSLTESLTQHFHRLRQGAIDEELFDVVAGFEAFTPGRRSRATAE